MGEERGERIPELVGKGLARVPGPTRAAVIGGGLAGVSAALVLAERGVQVTLYEAGPVLGGRLATIEHRVEATEPTPIGRGFHAFFRQYYNVRRLLRRIDPTLSHLTPLPDYPMLGADGAVESFADLPTRTPFNLIELTYRTKHLGLRDLTRVNVAEALSMLTFDMADTYERYDSMTARAYLDSLRFPPRARRMLFDVFAHSFFNPEDRMSAAELLMMFHFYFTGNPEGLLFDVLDRPFSTGLWDPLSHKLQTLGVTLQLGTRATEVTRQGRGYAVASERGKLDTDMVVLALDVPGLKRLVDDSPQLDAPAFRRAIAALDVTHPFYVWRMWLDRKALPERAAFAGTTELGRLDNISLFERFEDVTTSWSARRQGSCVELHAYAVEPDFDEAELRRELWSSLVTVYPELRDAKVLDECQFTRRDCPSFAPGAHVLRPEVFTALPGLALAGDYVKMPIPSALMERAVASGVLSANHLLAPLRVQSEPIFSVPRRGLLAPSPRLRKLRDRLRAGSLVGAPR